MAQKKKDDADVLNSGENVDKIRDILFGGQMRDYDKRFNELDQRIAREQKKLKTELESRFTKFENYVKSALEKLTEKDKLERSERLNASKSLTDQINSVSKDLTASVDKLDESMSQECMEIREELLKESREFESGISDLHTILQNYVDTADKQLDAAKVSREELSAYLSEVALRLNKDFKLPLDE